MIAHPIVIFGEALFDQYPDGQQILGGAPFNVAWHLQAFAQSPCFISRVGYDANGDKIKQAMQNWQFDMENLQVDSVYPTGAVQIKLNQGEPEYQILANQAYDFIDDELLDIMQPFPILYHGTLALRSPKSEQTLRKLVNHRPDVIFVDVNLRNPWWQLEAVHRCLARANWAKLNIDEFDQLSGIRGQLEQSMQECLEQFDLDVLVITCGDQGARALSRFGEWQAVKPEPISIVDTVGAGDAFAAILLLGIQRKWPLSVTMERAQLFASAVVTRTGAIVTDPNFYQPFINAWKLNES